MESGNEVRTRTTLDDVSLGNFSRLPGSMIYHMCSFLSARDVARTSILSKSWYCVSAIYSNITFHFTYEKSKLEDLFERGFPDGRFRQQVQRKKLDFLVQTDKSIRTRLEREANLQRLSLRDSCFAGRSLFERFLCGCPVIEYVKVWFYKIDELLSIPNLPRLEYFECVNCAIVDIIKMDAANLQKFYFGTSQSGWPETIDWATCSPALKEVIFNGNCSACIDVLSTLLSQLLFVETLELHDCVSDGNFKISSRSLKRLVFKDCSNLSFAQIDAPNLELLECVNCDEPFLPISASHQLQVHFSFVFRAHSVEWLLTLKAFVKKLKHWEDLKLIVYPEHQNKIADKLQIEGMIIHDKLSKSVLEKLKGLSSKADLENQLIRCEVSTSEAAENLKDPASSSRCRTSRITFKWKYDASQQRFIF